MVARRNLRRASAASNPARHFVLVRQPSVRRQLIDDVGQNWLRPCSNSSRDSPLWEESASIWSAPSALARSPGATCLLGPLLTQEFGLIAQPLLLELLQEVAEPAAQDAAGRAAREQSAQSALEHVAETAARAAAGQAGGHVAGRCGGAGAGAAPG